MTRTPAEAVRGLWQTLSARDYDGIAKRLRVGRGGLAAYENHDGLLVADGDDVMYEHSETWTFTSGEVVTLPFATVHQVRDGRVCLWKDYWDYGAIMNNAPAAWVEGLATADTSWVYDATGEV